MVKPVTPGTIVVLAGTVLLILCTITVPILKQFYFLKAVFPPINGNQPETLYLGVFGYCYNSGCSNASLGYTLDAAKIFGINGIAAEIPAAIPDTLIKWLTYVMILHPIAAGFGLIATVFGIISHLSDSTSFTTCFASIGAFIGLLAFIFDIVLFEIALKRINAVGGNAMLGNAVWLCLAGTLCLMFSGCFFGLGRCIIRKRKGDVDPNVNVAGKTMPILPDHYGAKTTLPQDDSVTPGGYGQGAMYKPTQSTGGSGLPIFQDRDGEIIPLTHMNDRMSMEEEEYNNDKYRRNGSYSNQTPQYPGGYKVPQSSSLVSGVGLGYGRRGENGNGIAFSPSGDSAFAAPIAPGAAGLGAGNSGGLNFAQQHQQQRLGSTVEPFVGMNHSPTTSEAQNYPNYGEYAPPSSPPPSQQYQSQQRSQSVSQQGSYRDGPSTSQSGYNSNSQGVEQTGAYYTLPPPTSHFSQPSLNSQPSYGQQSSYSYQDNTASSTPTSNYATAIASRYATPPQSQSQSQSQQYPPPSQSPPPSQQQQHQYPVPSNSPPSPSNPAPSYYSQSNRQPSQYSPPPAGARRYGSTVSATSASAAPTSNSAYGTAMTSETLTYQPLPQSQQQQQQQQHVRGPSQQSQTHQQLQRDSITSLGGEQGSIAGGAGNYNHGRNGSNTSYNNVNNNSNNNGRNSSSGGYQQQQQGDEAVQRRY